MRFPAALRRIGCRGPRAAAWVFVGSLALYLSNGRVVGQVDAWPNSLLSVAILVDGTLTFDRLYEGAGRAPPSVFITTPHGLVGAYPIATGLLALPFYALPIAVEAAVARPSAEGWIRFGWRFQKLPAAAFAALAVAVFWGLCRALGFAEPLSVGLTLWVALASENFGTAAQSLWQHGPGTLAILVAVGAQLALSRRPSAAAALVFSAASGLAVAVRPTNALILAPFAVAALWRRPGSLLPLAAPAVLLLALVAAYNLYFFDDLLGGYGSYVSSFAASRLGPGLAGVLVSPGRGLFLYYPLALVAFGLLAWRPRTLADPTMAAAAFAVVATILLVASRDVWWGGWSYGPRYLSEIEPLIALLVGLSWRELGPGARRILGIACFGLLLPWSVLVQMVGVYSPSAIAWNGIPSNVDFAPDRLWDLADNPISRGLHLRSATPPEGSGSAPVRPAPPSAPPG